MERVSSLRRYRILRATDRALLADAETNWVYFDLAASRPLRIPEEMRIAFGQGAEEE
jgi:acyl-CoA thioester hydrolase